MSTDNEIWKDSFATEKNENEGSRDGNQFEGDFGRPSYYSSERSDRPRRPRFSSGDNQRPQRSYGDRPQRNYGERSSYGDRPQYGGSERPFRQRYNNEGGDRPQRSYGERSSYGDRPQYGGSERPFRQRYNNEGGDRPQRSYGERPQYGDRPQRNYGDRSSYGDRPQYGGSERPFRQRYNNEGGDRPQRSYGERPQYGDRPQRPQRPYGAGNNRQGGGYGNNRPRRTADYNPNAKYSKKKQIEYKQQFVDPNEPIRLNKFLANAGVCSRREADEFITAGVVSVNGVVVSELGTKIKRGDEVKFHDQVVSIERKIYIVLNKPKDTVTTSDDPQARRTVMDLVKGACPERIYPVGRLDRNTTGVLLLTNDGDLASKLTHPKYLKKKIYHVHLDKNLTKADMDQIAAGIQLEDGEIHADAISYTDEAKKSDVGIEIHSGKNRIVRRIFESLGYKVVKLDRVYFAGLTKKGLRRGEWRFLNEAEVNYLRMGSFE
ncbi:MAG: pseudouridine synthase [Bacteroides sp.]